MNQLYSCFARRGDRHLLGINYRCCKPRIGIKVLLVASYLKCLQKSGFSSHQTNVPDIGANTSHSRTSIHPTKPLFSPERLVSPSSNSSSLADTADNHHRQLKSSLIVHEHPMAWDAWAASSWGRKVNIWCRGCLRRNWCGDLEEVFARKSKVELV